MRHILLSNDDGINAQGINTLADALRPFAKVTIIAPDRNRSAASSSLTLMNPLRPQNMGEDRYALNGTPADCVHLALNGFIDEKVDLVVSGINHGANLGDDVLYSGTVAAALEGRYLGLPAIAVSLVTEHGGEEKYFETAATLIRQIVEQLDENPLRPQEILNINVPNVPLEEVKGVKICRLGRREAEASIIHQTDPRGEEIYWIGPAGSAVNEGEGTDFHAVSEGFVSITPIQVDMTAYKSFSPLEDWLQRHI